MSVKEEIEGGSLVLLRKDYEASYASLYKRGSHKNLVSGKIYPQEVCLVTDSFNKHRQVVTPHGEIGWVHVNLLEKIFSNT